MVAKQKPAAFMSYVQSDDKYGHLTQFRERLSDEVRVHIGVEFPIFQDRKDILWGQNWKERIEESIDEVTFLIPIITPSFFNSSACRDELERFLEREKKLGRNDLVLPVYYVDCPLLNDEVKRAGDELAHVIATRQYADWRELRFEPFTFPQVGKTLAQLAVQIRDALDRVRASGKRAVLESDAGITRRPADNATVSLLRDIESMIASREPTRGPVAKTEPPTRVVDPMHHGDHITITEAIDAANPGDRILVRPGLYPEWLVIDKPGLEIIGDGNLDDVVVQAVGMGALLFKTTMGKVANLTLRQMGGGDWNCVDIVQGRLELDGCDITSDNLACVAIHDGADPRLRRNRIHDGKQSGVFVYENGQGVLEDNDIFGNALAGVVIGGGDNPTLRRNRIHDGGIGVFVYENGQGVLEDNEIFGNALGGVAIMKCGNPTLRRNRIHDDKQSGVHVHTNGQGVLEDNDIFGNAHSGVTIGEGGNPTLRRNHINKNGGWAVWVYDEGGGTIEDNDLRCNAEGAWNISDDREPNLRRARNKE